MGWGIVRAGWSWEMRKLNVWIIEISKVECLLRETTHNNTHEKIFLKNLLLLLAAASPSADAALVTIFSAFSLLSFLVKIFLLCQHSKFNSHTKNFLLLYWKFSFIFFLFWNLFHRHFSQYFSLSRLLSLTIEWRRGKIGSKKAQGKIYFVCGLNSASRESKSRKWTHSLGSLVTLPCTNSTFNATNSIQDEDFCTI